MNVSNLELILVQKISNSTSTLDTLIYSKALQELKTGTVTVVNTTADLPNPNTAFVGHLFYEKTTEAMYIVDQQGYARKIEAGTNIYTWGNNSCGVLGDGTTTSRSSPGTVAGQGANWKQISKCGASFSTIGAIKADGTLWTWGQNSGYSQLGDSGTSDRCSPGTTAGAGTNWCEVSIGRNHGAALKTDGTLWVWGGNTAGQLGINCCTNAIIARAPLKLLDGFTWTRVSAGYAASAAISNGNLWTWGSNAHGRLGDGTVTSRSSPGTTAGGGTNWCEVSMGSWFASAAIKTDGTLWTWGYNIAGQLGDGTTTSRSSPGTVAGGGNTWCAVSSGRGHMVAIKTDGTLWTWGCNGYGRLGDGTITNRSSPGTVAGGGTTWCQIGTGHTHTMAIKTDGTLWTWGSNTNGKLGDGTTTNRCSPGTVVGNITNWSKVSGGCNFTIAIRNFQ